VSRGGVTPVSDIRGILEFLKIGTQLGAVISHEDLETCAML
jgi:hypothetical protein